MLGHSDNIKKYEIQYLDIEGITLQKIKKR